MSVPFAEVQGSLALDLAAAHDVLPDALHAALVDALRDVEDGPPAAVVPIDRRARSEAEEWARRIVQSCLEVVGGLRPASQLVRWLSPTVYADLRRRARLASLAGLRDPMLPHPVRARVHSLHATYPTPGVLEAAAHIRHGARSRAVAVRFERREGRGWLCTALDFS